MKTVLCIAGTDCSGGAGIQADIKTITAHRMYATSVIAALTAQNTTGVYGVVEMTPEFIALQLDCVFSDIPPDAVKVGMVSSSKIIDIIAQKLIEYHAKNIIVDPVMVATSGSKLLNDDAISTLTSKLLPLANLITPNIPEAEVLSGIKISSPEHMICAAEKIMTMISAKAVLVKGGHLSETADDLLFIDQTPIWIKGRKVHTVNTHGTGCTLSSAIACNLAANLALQEAVEKAKFYVTGALRSGISLGKGNGPINHCWNL